MFRFWREESEDAQELAASDGRLRGKNDASESDAAGARTRETDQVDFDDSQPLLADDGTEPMPVLADRGSEPPSMLARDGHKSVVVHITWSEVLIERIDQHRTQDENSSAVAPQPTCHNATDDG